MGYIAIIIPLLTIMMASGLKNLEFEGSNRIWFGKDSKILKNYDNFRSIFGNDDGVSISFKVEEGVFNRDVLRSIDNITQKLWQTEYIARVDSITNYQYVHSDKEYPDEIVVENFVDEIDSLSDEELLKKRDIALKQEMILGRLISVDAKTTMIVGRMTPKAGNDPEVSFKLRDAVAKIVAPEEEKLGVKFYISGGPAINTSFIDIAKNDIEIFTPIVIVVTLILLFGVFRRVSATFISISVVVFTFLIVLSIQVSLGFKLNNFTANIPVFVMAIGIADAMHLLWIYMIARKKGMLNYEAIHYSVKKNFLALFLTSLTTAVGFASLSISAIVPIKTLGIATASAALLAFVLTILFVPAVLAIINPKIKVQNEEESHSHRISKWYVEFLIKYNKQLLFIFGIVFTIISVGIFKANVDSNIIKYFKEDVPIRVTIDFIQENLAGPMSYEIIVDSKQNDGIKEPEFLRTMQKFYDEFYAANTDVRHITSLMDTVKRFNEVVSGSKTIPDDKNLIAQYLLLYSLSLPQGMEISDKMDIDERQLRVSASMNMVETSKNLEMIKWVEDWWAKTTYSAEVNGQTAMFSYMQHDVTDTLLNSIALVIVLISIIMLLIFKKLKMLPLFIIPNLLPITLVVGVMGWLSIDIDMGVAVSGAIIIGVAVDDTIHLWLNI